MIAPRCPVPNCTKDAPRGSVFCPDHYFQIPPAYSRMVNRMAFECERAGDPEIKTHLREQLAGYIQVAIRSIEAPKPGEQAFNGSQALVEEHARRRSEFLDQLQRARSTGHAPETQSGASRGERP